MVTEWCLVLDQWNAPPLKRSSSHISFLQQLLCKLPRQALPDTSCSVCCGPGLLSFSGCFLWAWGWSQLLWQCPGLLAVSRKSCWLLAGLSTALVSLSPQETHLSAVVFSLGGIVRNIQMYMYHGFLQKRHNEVFYFVFHFSHNNSENYICFLDCCCTDLTFS